MKQKCIRFLNCYNFSKKRGKYLELFQDISLLSENQLTSQEIEVFLNTSFTEFDSQFFNNYFKGYSELLEHFNVLQVINFVAYIERLNHQIRKNMLTKMFYPLFLLLVAIIVLFIFKHYLLMTLIDLISQRMIIFINIVYFLTIIILLGTLLLIIMVVSSSRKSGFNVLYYNYFRNYKLFSLINDYYGTIFVNLLIQFNANGYSTLETFNSMRKMRNNRIITTIAYYLHTDLREGSTLDESITQSSLDINLKKVLKFAIVSLKYEEILTHYQEILKLKINRSIHHLSVKLYIIAYTYVGVLMLVFYQTISVPFSLMTQL